MYSKAREEFRELGGKTRRNEAGLLAVSLENLLPRRAGADDPFLHGGTVVAGLAAVAFHEHHSTVQTRYHVAELVLLLTQAGEAVLAARGLTLSLRVNDERHW